MKIKSSWVRQVEETARKAKEKATDTAAQMSADTKGKLSQLDDKLGVIDKTVSVRDSVSGAIQHVNDEFGIEKKVGAGVNSLKTGVSSASSNMEKVLQKHGIPDHVAAARIAVKTKVLDPLIDVVDKVGLGAGLEVVGVSIEEGYGKLRKQIKQYFAPENSEELLVIMKEELLYLNACILQVSPTKAEEIANRFGKAIASKVAGVASVGGILALVSAFGTAGTLTPIAALGGAAAQNATMAWVGGIVGGGMAAGAFVTGGIGLAVGVGVYKAVSSTPRKFQDLTDIEKGLVESTGFLIAAINDLLEKKGEGFSEPNAEELLNSTFVPMLDLLKNNCDQICENLDKKNAVLFKQHALVDFEERLIEGCRHYIAEGKDMRRYAEYVIGGVIYALLSNSVVPDTPEYQAALESLKRMKSDWNNASESDLSNALSKYSDAELKGVASNVKGIYHETLFVSEYNRTNEDTYAEMFEQVNHPGADIQIRSVSTGEVLEEFQLKASSSVGYVQEHFNKYPNISVLATSEVAEDIEGVSSTKISNDEISKRMDDLLQNISENTLADKAVDSAELAGIIAAGREAANVLKGKEVNSETLVNIASSASVASVSTAMVAYLFG